MGTLVEEEGNMIQPAGIGVVDGGCRSLTWETGDGWPNGEQSQLASTPLFLVFLNVFTICGVGEAWLKRMFSSFVSLAPRCCCCCLSMAHEFFLPCDPPRNMAAHGRSVLVCLYVLLVSRMYHTHTSLRRWARPFITDFWDKVQFRLFLSMDVDKVIRFNETCSSSIHGLKNCTTTLKVMKVQQTSCRRERQVSDHN